MGSFLDHLKAARYRPVAIRQRFRLEYNESTNDVYAFFESTDDATFYRQPITQEISSGGRLRTYLCGNKASVWFHYQFAAQEGKLRNALFFVDKDLDDLSGSAYPVVPRVFVTQWYAIENYICDVSALRAVMSEIIFIDEESQAYADAISQFTKGLQNLSVALRPLFAEVIELRRRNVEVVLNNFGSSLAKCFLLDDLELVPQPNWQDVFRDVAKYSKEDCDRAAVAICYREISGLDNRSWLRGKFAMWYFLEFVEQLWANLVGMMINEKKKVKKTLTLSAENVFAIMQNRHPWPAGLDAYLAANVS